MEAYAPGGGTTSAVLAFLSAWTTQLRANGYESGVYSSAASGVSDLVAQYDTGYKEPGEIWFADWNGEHTTSSWYIPGADWSEHQRLHQYDGGVNASYGSVTMNIDGDYLDGATAGPAVASTASVKAPVEIAPPSITGDPSQGRTLVEAHVSWSGHPTSYSYQWQDCDRSGADCSPIAGATGRGYTLRASDVGYTIRVHEKASNAGGTGGPARSAATGLVHGGSYWLYTTHGNVYNSAGAAFYGSPFASRVSTSAIVGMASTADGRGYWLGAATGNVYAYGGAASPPALAHAQPLLGIVP